MSIHDAIKSRRLKLGWSQTRLAEEVSNREQLRKPLTYTTVQQWENGTSAPKRTRMEHVAAALKTTVAELMSDAAPEVRREIKFDAKARPAEAMIQVESPQAQYVSDWPFKVVRPRDLSNLQPAQLEQIERIIATFLVPQPQLPEWRMLAIRRAHQINLGLGKDIMEDFIRMVDQDMAAAVADAKRANVLAPRTPDPQAIDP